jgi:hypothetical protein
VHIVQDKIYVIKIMYNQSNAKKLFIFCVSPPSLAEEHNLGFNFPERSLDQSSKHGSDENAVTSAHHCLRLLMDTKELTLALTI